MNNYEKLVKKLLREESERYMFFSNLEQMRRQCDMLLNMDREMIEHILQNGHDWAQDHIAEAKNNMDQVFDFLMNEIKDGDSHSTVVVSESKLDFILGKPISLIKRLHTTKYNPESGKLEKVTRDEEITGEVFKVKDNDPSSVPTLVVKCPETTCHIMYESSKDRFIEGESTYLYEYIPQSPKDDRILNLFKNNYYGEDEVIEEGKTKKNKPTNPALWKQCLDWARQRYEVCPSAYCNGAAAKRYKSKGGKWKKG